MTTATLPLSNTHVSQGQVLPYKKSGFSEKTGSNLTLMFFSTITIFGIILVTATLQDATALRASSFLNGAHKIVQIIGKSCDMSSEAAAGFILIFGGSGTAAALAWRIWLSKKQQATVSPGSMQKLSSDQVQDNKQDNMHDNKKGREQVSLSTSDRTQPSQAALSTTHSTQSSEPSVPSTSIPSDTHSAQEDMGGRSVATMASGPPPSTSSLSDGSIDPRDTLSSPTSGLRIDVRGSSDSEEDLSEVDSPHRSPNHLPSSHVSPERSESPTSASMPSPTGAGAASPSSNSRTLSDDSPLGQPSLLHVPFSTLVQSMQSSGPTPQADVTMEEAGTSIVPMEES